MAVKRLFVPAGLKWGPYAVEDTIARKLEQDADAMIATQEELDQLLHEGYRLIAQTTIETSRGSVLMLVLWRQDKVIPPDAWWKEQ